MASKANPGKMDKTVKMAMTRRIIPLVISPATLVGPRTRAGLVLRANRSAPERLRVPTLMRRRPVVPAPVPFTVVAREPRRDSPHLLPRAPVRSARCAVCVISRRPSVKSRPRSSRTMRISDVGRFLDVTRTSTALPLKPRPTCRDARSARFPRCFPARPELSDRSGRRLAPPKKVHSRSSGASSCALQRRASIRTDRVMSAVSPDTAKTRPMGLG